MTNLTVIDNLPVPCCLFTRIPCFHYLKMQLLCLQNCPFTCTPLGFNLLIAQNFPLQLKPPARFLLFPTKTRTRTAVAPPGAGVDVPRPSCLFSRALQKHARSVPFLTLSFLLFRALQILDWSPASCPCSSFALASAVRRRSPFDPRVIRD